MCKRVPLRCIHIAVRVYRRFYVYVTLAENVFVSHQYKMNSHIIPTHLRVRLLLFLFLRLIFFPLLFSVLALTAHTYVSEVRMSTSMSMSMAVLMRILFIETYKQTCIFST